MTSPKTAEAADETGTPAASDAQQVDRHLFIVDNIHLLRSLDNETVDLIVTDPPFGKRDTFTSDQLAPDKQLKDDEIRAERRQLADWGIRSRSQAEQRDVEWPPNGEGAQFTDIWTWDGDVHRQWFDNLGERYPAVHSVIHTARRIHDPGKPPGSHSLAAYLTFMAVRLIEMHRALKSTGSLFLHCDHTANSYLRLLLDAIFGGENLRNEIVWCYRGMPTRAKHFQRKHDTILFYTKSHKHATFNVLRTEPTEGSKRTYETGKRVGYNANLKRMMVTIFDRKKYERAVKEGKLPKGMREKDFAGGQTPMLSWWTDIKMLGGPKNKERNYPTQKPAKLAERIIAAASNPGDLVLDPFAGCAYVPVAAEVLGRRWVACDISPRAMTMIKRQFTLDGWEQRLDLRAADAKIALDFSRVVVAGPDELPTRTDEDPPVRLPPPLDEPVFKRDNPDMSPAQQKEVLARCSDYSCWACGFVQRDSSGTPLQDDTFFELDHIDPQSVGGSHFIHNKSLLCHKCNSFKGSKQISVPQLRELPNVIDRRKKLGVAIEDLVDWRGAQEKAFVEHAAWLAERMADS